MCRVPRRTRGLPAACYLALNRRGGTVDVVGSVDSGGLIGGSAGGGRKCGVVVQKNEYDSNL